ncbi:MAG: hypothetical protein M3N53_12200 [Actinomycetota bacterium]|nr:hypothetical protein [Actinomycetota bacterium]
MCRLWVASFGAVAVLAACTGSEAEPAARADAPGPAEVQLDAVEEHARQFDEDLPQRPAGSQQEFAAATYITGHLQQAGYEVRLASVPYKDLVRSTNVVALPPGGEPIEAVVTVLYDTTPSTPPHGRDIGLFLEIARALRVEEPNHRVQFVALGAEVTAENGGNLGSRALAEELAELEEKPPVIGLLEVPGGGFRAPGPAGDDLNRIALDLDLPLARPLSEPLLPAYLRATTIYAGERIPHAVAAGGVEEVGRVVLEFLGAR